MPATAYYAKGLTGGGADDLDFIDGAGLLDGDFAFVHTGTAFYFYWLDVDSAAAESSPDVISPDANAGVKRWILQPAVAFSATTNMLFGQSAAPTGWTKKTNWQDQSMIVYTTGNIAKGGSVDAKATHQHGTFTLAAAEMPAHTHSQYYHATGTGRDALKASTTDVTSNTGSTGGGNSHQHTANSAPYYISVISAIKD